MRFAADWVLVAMKPGARRRARGRGQIGSLLAATGSNQRQCQPHQAHGARIVASFSEIRTAFEDSSRVTVSPYERSRSWSQLNCLKLVFDRVRWIRTPEQAPQKSSETSARAEIVYGDQALSEPVQKLVDLFQNNGYEGTLYIGYPILSNVEGTVRVDALYVSPSSGVVVFDANHLQIDEADEKGLDEIRETQNRYFAAINSKPLETPELLERRKLAVPITIVSISSDADFESG